MPSQFFGLNIAYSGLSAANIALNTTGNNVTNKDTPGYSRQYVQQKASDALRTYSTYGCAGAGVDTIAIERMRDEFYDVKYWNNNADLGAYTSKAYYMKQIENYYLDDKTMEGFGTIFDKFNDALQELKKNPSDPNNQGQVVGDAGSLSSYFNDLAGNMEKLQKDTNQEIKVKVDAINSYAARIASLSEQINVIEQSGTTANELRDQRDLLIDGLSSIVDVEIEEVPIKDSNDPDRVTGANNYRVRIAGGQMLVNGTNYNTLNCVGRQSYEKVNQTDIDGLYDLQWSHGADFNLAGNASGGELKALLEMRDGNNSANFQGNITDVVNAGGINTVTIQVDLEHLKDLQKSTLSDSGGKINLGNKEYYYDSWTYKADNTTNPPTYTYEFELSGPPKNPSPAGQDRKDKKAEIGTSIAYQGIPYYMQQMNEWVRNYAAAANGIITQPGSIAPNKDPGINLFTGNIKNSNNQFEFDTPLNGVAGVKPGDDSYYRLTAKNFAISKEIVETPSKLATTTQPGGTDSGPEKSDIVEQLIDLKTNKDKMSFRGASASEFLECMTTDITLNAKRANNFVKNYINLEKNINQQRLSVSGVDGEEEGINMVKYQHSYDLASKMIQVLTEIYDQLILSTGV